MSKQVISHGVRSDILPVILGGDIGAYAIGREFHEAYGVNSVIINTGYIGAIEHSSIFTLLTVDSLEAHDIVAAVSQLAANNPERTLLFITNSEQAVGLIEGMVDILPKNVFCCVPSRAAYDAVSDKAAFYELCHTHGLDTPRTEIVKLAGTEAIPATRLSFPVVIKPAVSAEYYSFILKGFQKVYFMTAQAELDQLWSELRAAGFTGTFLVQELVEGDDTYTDSLTIYIGLDGSPRMLGAAQVLLEDHAPTMLGNPVAMLIRRKEELWDKVGHMLAACGYRGFANFDIKRDPKTGRELFLDCNPRIGRNSYYNVAAGVNPMRVLVRDLVDGESDAVLKATDPALYTLVPLKLLRRYVREKALLDEIDELVQAGRVFDPQRYDRDWGLRRRLDVELTERNHVRKFAKYYPKPTDTSF